MSMGLLGQNRRMQRKRCMASFLISSILSTLLISFIRSAHLKFVTAQTPIPGSPTTSLSSLSTAPPPSAQPTAHTVMIAQVLLALLESPPLYSIPLNQLKTMISGTEAGMGLIGTAVTKPIYNLVAKRCLKIDRGGKEQMVKFAV